jgi:hypothetical protein
MTLEKNWKVKKFLTKFNVYFSHTSPATGWVAEFPKLTLISCSPSAMGRIYLKQLECRTTQSHSSTAETYNT